MGGCTGGVRPDGGGVPAHGLRDGLRDDALRDRGIPQEPTGALPEPRPDGHGPVFMNGMLPRVAPHDSSMAPRPAPLPDTPLRGLQSGSAQQPGRVPEWFRDSPAKRVTWVRFPPRPPVPLHRATSRRPSQRRASLTAFTPHAGRLPPAIAGHFPDCSGHTCPGNDRARCSSSSLRPSVTTRKPTPPAHAHIPVTTPETQPTRRIDQGFTKRSQLTPSGRDRPSFDGFRHCGMQTLLDTTRPVAESNLSVVKHLGGFSL